MPRDNAPEPMDFSQSDCIHHWLLEAPSNGYIEAHCRRCSEIKLFAATSANRWNRSRTHAPAQHVTSGTPG